MALESTLTQKQAVRTFCVESFSRSFWSGKNKIQTQIEKHPLPLPSKKYLQLLNYIFTLVEIDLRKKK